MKCDMCGKEIMNEEATECAGCGMILCPECSISGFCANCIGGGILD